MVRAPEVELKFTVTPVTTLLFASRTSAVRVADLEPSEGICGRLVIRLMVCCVFTTMTAALAEIVPAVAVTVIEVPAAAPLATSVAVATPLALVTACVTTRLPAVEEKVMVTPLTALLLASLASAERLAIDEPSDGIETTSDVSCTVATEVPPPPPVLQVFAKEVPQSLPPPQAARKRAARGVNQRRLRILIT